MLSLNVLIWVAIAVALTIAEIFTAGFFIIFFAAGAAITAIACLFIQEQVTCLTIFLLSSSLLLIFARPTLKKLFNITDLPPKQSNVSSLIGEDVLVLETVNRYGGRVRLLHSGEIWSAYLDESSDGEPIPVDEEGIVSFVDGAKLAIKPKTRALSPD